MSSIVDLIRESAPEWDILGVTVAGESDDEQIVFVDVIRSTESDDGDLILSERYVRVDLEAEEIAWLDNGIERRMSRGFADALSVLYAAASNEDLDAESPMLIETRDGYVDYEADDLRQSISEVSVDIDTDADDEPESDTDADDETDEPESSGKSVSAHEATDGRDNDLHQAEHAPTCSQCGQPIEDTDEAVNLGGALGKDTWTHHRCPQDGDE